MDNEDTDIMSPGADDEPIVRLVPAQGGSVQDKPVQDGPVRDGPVQDSPVRGGLVRDIMTPAPIGVYYSQTIGETARIMRDTQVGVVLVVNDGQLTGLVTDRDLVIRGLAEGEGPDSLVGPLCSGDLVGVTADAEIALAEELMRDHAVRRLPVISEGQVVGIVSLGDLAISEQDDSPLAAVSRAQGNI
jgi:CBS domain-containing protein